MNAALIGVITLAIVLVVADGMIKVRAANQRADRRRPVTERRLREMNVINDPGLDIDNQPTVTVVLMDIQHLLRGDQ